MVQVNKVVLFAKRRCLGISGKDFAIQVMSDLHLELFENYVDFNIPQRAPYLLLAGDIGRLSQYDKFAAFLTKQCNAFKHVYLVLGNHEPYALHMSEALERTKQLCVEEQIRGRLTILSRTRVDITEEVTLLGCTLYSLISQDARQLVQMKVADFRKIKGWSIDHHNLEHQRDLNWLRDEVENIRRDTPDRRVIIATHYAPSLQRTSDPKHRDNAWNSAFGTDLIENSIPFWIGVENISHWVFGHTHWCCEFETLGIQFLSNQRGYFLNTDAGQHHRESFKQFATRLILSKTEPTRQPPNFDVKKCIRLKSPSAH